MLLGIAAPVEARAVLDALVPNKPPVPALWEVVPVAGAIDLLHTGVSKANAAGALALALSHARHSVVVNLGIAGALPQVSPLRVTETIVADQCVFADEGILTPQGYRDVASIGFPITPDGGSALACDARLVEAFSTHTTRVGAIATVSTCSATDALAGEVARRTGALAETMEGAAMALVAARMGAAFVEVRAISNLTGDRGSQAWDIAGALGALRAVVRDVLASLA